MLLLSKRWLRPPGILVSSFSLTSFMSQIKVTATLKSNFFFLFCSLLLYSTRWPFCVKRILVTLPVLFICPAWGSPLLRKIIINRIVLFFHMYLVVPCLRGRVRWLLLLKSLFVTILYQITSRFCLLCSQHVACCLNSLGSTIRSFDVHKRNSFHAIFSSIFNQS